MQFYPADWICDTRRLTPAARGIWIDILVIAWNEPQRGIYHRDMDSAGRELGIDQNQLAAMLAEIHNVATVTFSNGAVTVQSRRMIREEKARELGRNRAQRYRDNASVTQPNGNVTPKKSEVRSQKSETKKTTTPFSEPQKAAASDRAPIASKSKPYQLPDPKTNPKGCLIISYKTRKGIAWDSRDWDKANWGRSMVAAGTLLGLCGDLKSSEACLGDLAEDYDAKGLSWTLETISRNAADWLKKNGRNDANSSRAGLRLAIAKQRTEASGGGGVAPSTNGETPDDI